MPGADDRRRGRHGRRLDHDVVEVVLDDADRVRQRCCGRWVAAFEHVVDEGERPDGNGVGAATGKARIRRLQVGVAVVDRHGQVTGVGVRDTEGSHRRSRRLPADLFERPRADRRRRRRRGDRRRGHAGTSRRSRVPPTPPYGAVPCGPVGWRRLARPRSGRASPRSVRRRSRASARSTPPCCFQPADLAHLGGRDEPVARRHRGAVVEERGVADDDRVARVVADDHFERAAWRRVRAVLRPAPRRRPSTPAAATGGYSTTTSPTMRRHEALEDRAAADLRQLDRLGRRSVDLADLAGPRRLRGRGGLVVGRGGLGERRRDGVSGWRRQSSAPRRGHRRGPARRASCSGCWRTGPSASC